MGRLDDRVANISGGAGGIGAATGQLFCEQGAAVVLVDLHSVAMEAACAAIRRAVPGRSCLLRRWASPREIAYSILWLASEEASYVTGTALMAYGGGLTP